MKSIRISPENNVMAPILAMVVNAAMETVPRTDPTLIVEMEGKGLLNRTS
jgi:hypothetical protein